MKNIPGKYFIGSGAAALMLVATITLTSGCGERASAALDDDPHVVDQDPVVDGDAPIDRDPHVPNTGVPRGESADGCPGSQCGADADCAPGFACVAAGPTAGRDNDGCARVCVQVADCQVNADCRDPNRYCKLRPYCGAGASPPGTCTAIPATECARKEDPVCGCDGQTYTNACSAERAGAAVLRGGACDAARESCAKLERQYVALLADGKRCESGCVGCACRVEVAARLSCSSCRTFIRSVAVDSKLRALAARWKSQSCGTLIPCTVGCVGEAPRGGSCAGGPSDLSCVDR